MAITFSDYFAKAGKLLAYAVTTNTARGTTIPPKVTNIISQFASVTPAIQNTIAGIFTSLPQVQQGCAPGPAAVRAAMSAFLQQTIVADVNIANLNDQNAIQTLISQMVANSQTVKRTTPAVSVTAGGSNNGDAVVVASVKRGDGLLNENTMAETVTATVTTATNPATASLTFSGQTAESDSLDSSWPLGSGCSQTINAVSASSSLLTNGAFETSTVIANVPDSWIVSVGTVGTTLKMTVPEVQTLAISGTPTTGTYQISWSNPSSKVQVTAPLAYNATSAQVQAALRLLTGLSQVTVTSTGTSPNFTHSITFTGVAGNLSQITVVNNSTGGTLTPGTTTNGSANAFVGLSLLLVSNGSELTTIQQQLTNLSPLSQYAVNLWAMADIVPAAGVLTVDLVDGIGGSVIQDAQGVNNSFTINAHTALTTSFQAFNGVFRTPRVMPALVYLRIRISTAVSSGSTVSLDQVALTPMTVLYAGGPSVAVFSGKNSLTAGDATNPPDSFSLAVTSDRAGAWQEWFDRIFDMKGKGLLLPSVTGGTETIANSLIA